jgi:predicted NBD/HSP70 family sugar kinase
VNLPYHFPTPRAFMHFASQGLQQILARLGPLAARRIAGLGIAAPFELWKWEEEIGAPHEVMEAWKGFNLSEELKTHFDWPILPCNDATAACAAELFYGRGQQLRDFAYVYVGYFIGGGLVINGQLYQGPTGNAGAIGSLPVAGHGGQGEQLIRQASLYRLEQALVASGLDPSFLWHEAQNWSAASDTLDQWTLTAARGIALACTSIASVVDTPAIVIDGSMPEHVRKTLVDRVKAELQHINMDGISPFEVSEGSIGVDARALGAASLPLFANFMINRDVLFRDGT